MKRLSAATLAVCLGLGGAGCMGCPTALLDGILVADGAGGLAVRRDQNMTPVEWPDGIGVGRDGGLLVLTNPFGLPIAHEGEFVSMGGGQTLDGSGFKVCGPISVSASAPPTSPTR